MTFNSLTTKKQTSKLSSANLKKKKKKKNKTKLYHIENSKTSWQTVVDLDGVAHYEPPHQDLRCLQIQLFLSVNVSFVTSVYQYSFCTSVEGIVLHRSHDED